VEGRKESLKAGCFVVAQLLVSSAAKMLNPASSAGERWLGFIKIRILVTLY
jgi:hypothetical protein